MSKQKGQAFYNEGEEVKTPKGESRMALLSVWPHPDRENQWLAAMRDPTNAPVHVLILEDAADVVSCLRHYAELSISDKVWAFVVNWEDCPVLDLLKKARMSFRGILAAIKVLSKRYPSHG